MRSLIHVLAALAVLAAPAGLSAQTNDNSPACRADLDGERLTTTIRFSDGYTITAPWEVEWNRPAALDNGAEGVAVGATLDRVVEVDPETGERRVTPFPEPIETTFEGENEEAMVYRAAQIWCLTVLKAQQNSKSKAPRGSRTRASIG